jgi:hypothetical protein
MTITESMIDGARLLGPFVGAAVATLGLGFVIRQLRLGYKALEGQTRAAIYQMSQSTYKIFIDRPELRPYFYNNLALPDEDPERSRVLAAAELLCDYFEHVYFSRKNLPKELSDTWISYMKMLYDGSSAMKFYVDTMSSQYSESFLDTIRGGSTKKLGRANNPKTKNKAEQGATGQPSLAALSETSSVVSTPAPVSEVALASEGASA